MALWANYWKGTRLGVRLGVIGSLIFIPVIGCAEPLCGLGKRLVPGLANAMTFVARPNLE